MAPKVVMLMANETNPTNLQNADKLRTLFRSKKIIWEEIDGTDSQNKGKRSELFGISGMRAEYPQVFFQDPASSQYLFIGNYGKIAGLNENAEMLRSHPEIMEHNVDAVGQVFDKVFAEVMPGFVATDDTKSSPVQNTMHSDMHFDFDALEELEAEQKITQAKALADEAEVEVKLEAKAEEADEEDPVSQPESPMTVSPTSARTAILGERQEEKGPQCHESKEVVLLEEDAAEDTDEKTQEAQEKREESSKKTQRLRKRDRVKRWFKRLTCTQRT